MSQEEPEDDKQPGWLDHVVENLAQLMNAVGLNGTRLLWRWRQKKRDLAERGLRTEILWRSAKGKHKMCPSCRTLVERSASECTECGRSLRTVRSPGVGRMVTNLIPGVTAVTSLIMLVNGFWFVMLLMAEIKTGGSSSIFSFSNLENLVRFGAGLSRPRLLSDGLVVGGEPWRLVTPIFLHSGLLHFFFNSFLLIQLGPIVEEIYGSYRFWVIYLSCGIMGVATSWYTRPRMVITVGASGAIMGLIGLLLVYGYRHRGSVLGQSMKNLLFRLVIYSLILSFAFNIDHRNHAGGFLCGALLALVVPSRDFRSRGEELFWQLLAFLGVLIVLASFGFVALQARSVEP